jgi:N-acetylglutamate synthase-like GNAT family acetyltransferase
MIRPATPADHGAMERVINEAAMAYKGVIPPDCWHEPYMPLAQVQAEIGRGVRFRVFEEQGEVVACMGIQDVRDVTLVRHAYVRTDRRGAGIGSALLAELLAGVARPVLVGTWRAAVWAVGFYQKHGFALVTEEEKNRLLRTYWAISERQVQTSVVLADQRWLNLHRPASVLPPR